MNYKQNQRIEQMTDATLLVGIDIAKKVHVARAQDHRGIQFGKAFSFENTASGLRHLLSWVSSLMRDHEKEHVLFGMEPTGHYWLPLAYLLRKQGHRIGIVNPMHVKKSKELDDNSPTKNDAKDARVIAQLLKDGRFSEPHFLEGIHAELRVGMNLRDTLTRELVRIQGRVINWLDRFFPEFTSVFKDWEGKVALLTLLNFPFPAQVASFGAEAILSTWKQQGVIRGVGMKRAIQLVEVAKESIGLTSGTKMAKQELRMLLDQYLQIQQQMSELTEQIQEMLKDIPGTSQMMTIPGIGWITVAGFLSEVGDLSKYDHPQQIQKLAGLNLKENSSGKRKGKTHITKRGRPLLRALLFRASLPLVSNNQEFRDLHLHFTTRTDNPLSKKQSLIALCCKLIRVFFALGRKQIAYDSSKMRMGFSTKLSNVA